jgi:glutathione S-transferase
LTRFVNYWSDAVLLPALLPIIVCDVFDSLAPCDRGYFRQSREERLGMPLEDAVANRGSSIAAFHKALAPFRRLLTDQKFLAGPVPAYADYCVFGMFMWAHCTSPTQLLETCDPIHAWRERLFDAFGGLARHAVTASHTRKQ